MTVVHKDFYELLKKSFCTNCYHLSSFNFFVLFCWKRRRNRVNGLVVKGLLIDEIIRELQLSMTS